jgi:hypothetical protein
MHDASCAPSLSSATVHTGLLTKHRHTPYSLRATHGHPRALFYCLLWHWVPDWYVSFLLLCPFSLFAGSLPQMLDIIKEIHTLRIDIS